MKIGLYFVLLLALSGCLSRKPLTKQTFALTVSHPAHVTAPANAPSLTLRQIFVAAPFDSPAFTYRTGQFSYERDPYAGFIVSPAETLNDPIRALLQNSGKFSSVNAADSSIRGDLDLEISVTQLYGDFQNKSQPAAVLEMHFVMFKQPEHFSRSSKSIIVDKTYSRRIPLKASTAGAFVEAVNQALGQVVTQFADDVPVK